MDEEDRKFLPAAQLLQCNELDELVIPNFLEDFNHLVYNSLCLILENSVSNFCIITNNNKFIHYLFIIKCAEIATKASSINYNWIT